MTSSCRVRSQRRRAIRWTVAVAVSAGGLAVSGCGSMMVNATEARVRFAVVSADAPALDVYLNGTGAAYNLGFATYSSYVPVSAGNYQFSASRANTGQTLVTAKSALVSGHQYTALVCNRLGTLQEHIFPDAVPAAVPGTLAVRLLNEVEGGPLDVYLVPNAGVLGSTPPVVTGLVYGVNAGYLRLPANASYAVYAGPAGSSAISAAVGKVTGATVSGASGAARTLVLTEAAREGKGLYGLVLEDGETP